MTVDRTNPSSPSLPRTASSPGQGRVSNSQLPAVGSEDVTVPESNPLGWRGRTSTGNRPAVRTTGSQPAAQSLTAFGQALAAGGAQSIELRMKAHLAALEKTGVGTYYGDHSPWKTMDQAQRAAWLEQNLKPEAKGQPRPPIKESSCIGWAFENLGAAYAAAGKSERWQEILKAVAAKGSKGIDLAKELQQDGWQAIYWNPDARNPDDGNAEHSFSATQVKKGNGYYGVAIDDTVLNYRPSGKGSTPTTKDTSGLEKLKQVPFFFGLAKGGMHTFVGRGATVNEFHWNEMPNSPRAMDETPLESWKWNSGVIMVPPGTWPTALSTK